MTDAATAQTAADAAQGTADQAHVDAITAGVFAEQAVDSRHDGELHRLQLSATGPLEVGTSRGQTV